MKKFSAIFLCILLVFSICPTVPAAFADEYTNEVNVKQYNAVSDAVMTDFCNLMKTAIENHYTNVSLTGLGIADSATNEDTLTEAIQSLIDEYPLLYNLKSHSYTLGSVSGYKGRMIKAVNLTYYWSASEYARMNNKFEEYKARYFRDIYNNKAKLSDVEKALLVHDRILDICKYDIDNFLKNPDNIPDVEYTMYGCLVNGVAVCQGYAKTYKLIMNELGINCRLCGSDKLDHVWNIVNFGGREYYVDCTLDEEDYDVYGKVNHDYFLVSFDKLYLNEHTANDYDCTVYDTEFDYGAAWEDIDTAFTLYNGKIYFVDNAYKNAGDKYGILFTYSNKTNTRDGESINTVCNVDGAWLNARGTYQPKGYARLCTNGQDLFISASADVYKLNTATNSLKNFYTASFNKANNEYGIYGMTYKDDYLYLQYYCSDAFLSDTAATHTKKLSAKVDKKLTNISSVIAAALKKSVKSVTYSGKAKTLTIKGLSVGGKALKKYFDYTVTYKNNIKAGKATVTVKGCGDYTGSGSANFTIKKKSIKKCKVNELEDASYTGKKITPKPKVLLGSKILKRNKDYKLLYKNNKKLGLATITVKGIGNYKYSKKVKFRIRPSAVKKVDVIGVYSYKIVLKWKKLKNGTGYAVMRATSENGKYKTIALLPSLKTTTYTDSKVKAGRNYYYKVLGYVRIKGKNYAGPAKFITLAGTGTKKSSAPSVAKNGDGKVTISYGDVKNADGYELSYSMNGGAYKVAYTGEKTSVTASNFIAGNVYRFRVRSYRKVNGNKIYSDYGKVKKYKY